MATLWDQPLDQLKEASHNYAEFRSALKRRNNSRWRYRADRVDRVARFWVPISCMPGQTKRLTRRPRRGHGGCGACVRGLRFLAALKHAMSPLSLHPDFTFYTYLFHLELDDHYDVDRLATVDANASEMGNRQVFENNHEGSKYYRMSGWTEPCAPVVRA